MKRIVFYVIVVMISSCSAKTVPSKTASGHDAGTVAVLTYNIHHANPPSKPNLIDIDAIARVIKKQNPDIVALQEVDAHTRRSGVNINEAEEIARLTGMKAYFARSIDYDGGAYGVAILSKLPVRDFTNTALPTDDNTKGEHRTLATAKIELANGNQFVFACTHLDAQHADVNRQLQIKKILGVLRQESLPVVIAGDLNATPNSDVINQLDSHFTRSCVGDCPFTIPEISPNKTIDYIAYAPASAFRVVSHQVVDESYASDHRPVKAVLQLQ